MYTFQQRSLRDFPQPTESGHTAVLNVSNVIFLWQYLLFAAYRTGVLLWRTVNMPASFEQTAAIGKGIEVEGESVIEELTGFLVKLTEDPETPKIVGIIDEAVDVVTDLLGDTADSPVGLGVERPLAS